MKVPGGWAQTQALVGRRRRDTPPYQLSALQEVDTNLKHCGSEA